MGQQVNASSTCLEDPHKLLFSLQNSAISPSLILLEKTFVSSIKMSTATRISDDDDDDVAQFFIFFY